ncbi:unnamed protein product [Plutella xylostella]|uniref:(diamondback moth) hypothetical protein n=1 Tax=Plutella xylostella TaxID=51655 RepID=A0A8S4GE45_PLUXY|nr:unnamed protein product [Plutella xylostella]
MPVIKTGYGIPKPRLAAEGIISHDLEALSPFQRDCTTRLGAAIQVEHEAYLAEHPEVLAMMKRFVAEMTRERNYLPQDRILRASAEYFTRPEKVLEEEVRQDLGLTPDQHYTQVLQCDRYIQLASTKSKSTRAVRRRNDVMPQRLRSSIDQQCPSLQRNTTEPCRCLLRRNTFTPPRLVLVVASPVRRRSTSCTCHVPMFNDAATPLRRHTAAAATHRTKLSWHKKDEFSTLGGELKTIKETHFPPDFFDLKSSSADIPETVSSTFVSIVTSDTTLPTPDPIPTPELTVYETLYQYISNACDKAIYTNVSDDILRYDTAYVELMCAVERAMEIPVSGVKEDIAELLYNAYQMFEVIIREKEQVGYETPPTPKSTLSSHPSYLVPLQRPCECAPQFHYNRYPKDRFGRYLPQPEPFSNKNVTITPQFSIESVTKKSEEEKIEEENLKERSEEEEEIGEESLKEENEEEIEQGEDKSVHSKEIIA